jgi:hypothetical protein
MNAKLTKLTKEGPIFCFAVFAVFADLAIRPSAQAAVRSPL